MNTNFGALNSKTDLHLAGLSFSVGEAKPKTKYVNIPGANGSLDLTEANGVLAFEDRTLEWTFSLFPGDRAYYPEYAAAAVSKLNGHKFNISVSEIPGYYFVGRVSAKEIYSGVARYIEASAICEPWMYKTNVTTVTKALSASYSNVSIPNDLMPTTPTFVCEAATTVKVGTTEYAMNAGTHIFADIVLAPGANTIKAKGSGTLQIKYQEGRM